MRDLVKEGREILENFSKMFEIGEDEDSEEITDKNKPQIVTGADIVLDNDLILITTPKNIQHVKDVSKDTKWMASGGLFYGTMFDRYKKEKYTTYFIQLKPKSPKYNDRLMRKIAVIISPSNQIIAYDSFDGMIDISKIYKATNTSRNLYKKLT